MWDLPGPGDWACVTCIARQILNHWITRKAQYMLHYEVTKHCNEASVCSSSTCIRRLKSLILSRPSVCFPAPAQGFLPTRCNHYLKQCFWCLYFSKIVFSRMYPPLKNIFFGLASFWNFYIHGIMLQVFCKSSFPFDIMFLRHIQAAASSCNSFIFTALWYSVAATETGYINYIFFHFFLVYD